MKKTIYSEEYQQILNRSLKKHPLYRPDMQITIADPRGHLVFKSKNLPITQSDNDILNEVCNEVALVYRMQVI